MQSPDETGALLRRLIVPTHSSRTRILVADDDVAIRQLITRSLEQVGHHVTCAHNGEEVIEKLGNGHGFDLLILDAMMPKKNGFETCLALRADPDNNRLPILLVTALADKRSRLRAHESGASEFITKPIDRVELLTRVDHQIKLTDYEALQRDYAVKLEAEVASLTQTLFRAERLAFLGTLAGAVGHELNNLTTVMQSALYLVNRDIEEGQPPDPESLDDLASVLAHLKNHGKQLLNLGRPQGKGDGVADVNNTLEHCVHTLQMTGRTKLIAMDVKLPEVSAHVGLPVERLEQVFFNLIGNAADAVSHRGGMGRIEVNAKCANDAVIVEIVDNGPGIPPAILDRIFEPYFTTKGPDAGTGLGLVVVKQILDKFGGHIEVKTEADVGTKFIASFPTAQAPPAFATFGI